MARLKVSNRAKVFSGKTGGDSSKTAKRDGKKRSKYRPGRNALKEIRRYQRGKWC